MDKKALYKLSYGVFMLSTKVGSKVNGCITNTCMQVAGSPTRIAICVINTNYTCDLIKESGVFALTLLDQTTGFELIQHFGFQSGRDVDKFANLRLPEDVNGIPYLAWQACAVISGKVVNSLDQEQRPIKGFRCRICGYVYEGPVLPEDFLCPLCGHGPEDFEPVYAD